MLELHRFFIAVSRAGVNHDGFVGTGPDTLVWSVGALPRRRRLVHAVRDHAMLPGPAVNCPSDWVSLPPSVVTAEDVGPWPYSVDVLVKCVLPLVLCIWQLLELTLGWWGFLC